MLNIFTPAQAIEVLLKNRAFVVKRLPADMPPSADNRKGQVTWSKYESVLAAWNDAKFRAGFNWTPEP